MMGVGDGDGERVRGVRPDDLHAGQQARHHGMDLILRRIADADHGFLDQPRGIFADLHAGARGVEQDHAARLSQFQGRLRIDVDEHLLDRRAIGPMFEDEVGQGKIERQQPRCQRHRTIRLDLAIAQMREAVAVGGDQTPAGGAKAGVETKEDHQDFIAPSGERIARLADMSASRAWRGER